MKKITLITTAIMIILFFTGCPEPKLESKSEQNGIKNELSIILPKEQLKDITTKGKDIGITSNNRLDSVIWRVVKKPKGSHPALLNSKKKSDTTYYKFFKPDIVGIYTIKVEARANGKVATETANINVVK